MDTVSLTYVGTCAGGVEIPDVGHVPHGATFACPSELAGKAPSDDDSGSGLLAQVDNFKLARKASTKEGA